MANFCTAVLNPVRMVTDLAVERLMGLIAAGDDLPEARVTLIDPDLIIRASTIGML